MGHDVQVVEFPVQVSQLEAQGSHLPEADKKVPA